MGFDALIPYIFMVVGILFIYFAISIQIRGRQSQSWPVTEGEIITSQDKDHSGELGTNYQSEVRYKYEVNNQTYQSNRISYGGGWGKGSLVFQYQPGKKVRVYYNPKKPKTATLIPGSPFDAVFWLAVIGIFGVSSGLCLFTEWGKELLARLLIG